MEKIDLNTGQFIFKAGEKSDKVFLLLEGEVGIFLPTNDTQQPNHKIQENEIFGETSLLLDATRSVSVVAGGGGATARKIPKNYFVYFVSNQKR